MMMPSDVDAVTLKVLGSELESITSEWYRVAQIGDSMFAKTPIWLCSISEVLPC